MKLPVISLCIIAEALAYHPPSVFRRDLTTITGVLNNVTSSIEKLQAAVKTGFDDPEPLLLASNGLIAALKTGAVRINGTGDVNFLDSIRLIGPVHQLSALGESLARNLQDVRGGLKAAGLCDVTRLQISSIGTRSQDLINAVNGKIPKEAQTISRALTSGLTDILERSKDQFSEQSCREANNGTLSSESVSLVAGRSMMALAACVLVALSSIIIS
ncbi:hypothetical protein E4U43_001397 [Claviceps pusilla]|uniref:Uncharacterized protein n=1 Tax=Claviceps pusilla TaxID=123648 RepID=A0A9P7NAD3_9HYPO|nr:hypothetical protein E4U43_001397 [Claviceps pusilla]